MGESQRIKTALSAADSAILLQSPEPLAKAAEAWRECAVLGLDTEFVRERTYHANIGLVQISDGQTVWLLDPLADRAIGPLRELLENRGIAKIVHSPSEDLDVLRHATGTLPDPILDTQLACAMLGQPLQMGYHKAVEWLLGMEIEKDQTRSNWCKRPLTPQQLRYAALDVCLLPEMWQRLAASLVETGRLDWLKEDCGRQLELARVPPESANAWQRIRGIGRLDGASLAILQALAEWREKAAQQRNLPRGFVMTDPHLLSIARNKMRNRQALEELDDLHPRALSRYGDVVIRRVTEVLDSGRKLPEIKPMNGRQRTMLKRLRALVLERAGELGVEPALLAPKRELEELVMNGGGGEIPRRLDGWRHGVITADLQNLVRESR